VTRERILDDESVDAELVGDLADLGFARPIQTIQLMPPRSRSTSNVSLRLRGFSVRTPST